MAEVVLDIENQRVTAIITADAIRDLGLKAGDNAIAVINVIHVMACRP